MTVVRRSIGYMPGRASSTTTTLKPARESREPGLPTTCTGFDMHCVLLTSFEKIIANFVQYLLNCIAAECCSVITPSHSVTLGAVTVRATHSTRNAPDPERCQLSDATTPATSQYYVHLRSSM